ncbi:floral homeotic protein [Salix suchowensis]|nr:floral homeotic protein [Salix suchowensis]
MGRGKIEIKKIENPTNRQVTYSERRNGIFKKAQELTVLCDAKVSLIMFSNTSELHEYISPSTTTKKIYDQYQKALGTDLWSAQYEKMQEQLRKLKDINHMLKKEIRQRIGEDLNELSIDHLRDLEQNMSEALNGVRGRKYHVIKTQIDIYKKKVRNLEDRYGNLRMEYEARLEDPQYGLVDSEGDYESAAALVNGVSNLYICIPPAPRAASPPAPPPAS